jgi:hypothetical protein
MKKIVQDSNGILDARKDTRKGRHLGANKKEIAEYKTFLIQAPANYIVHVEG